MKYASIILILLLEGVTAKGQVFEDDFSDGDFSSNPTWLGADSDFVIFDLDGNNVLRLNGNGAASSFLSTPSSGVTGYWEFFIQIDGSAPSGSNKAEIILISDIADLTGAFNGYGIRIGESGADYFHLIRYDSGIEASIVVSDTTLFEARGSYRIKVRRDVAGNWNLEVGKGYNGELKDSGNSGFDDVYSTSSFFGIRVTYTSSRVDDYYFDFKIDTPIVPIDPLLVDSLVIPSDSEIELSFSRDIDVASAVSTNFLLNGRDHPRSVTSLAANALHLSFDSSFLKGENQLAITGIQSSTKDTVISDTTIAFFKFEDFKQGDVLINEFLKDPPPGSGIPEYIEIINRTTGALNLKDWQVGDSNTLNTISDTDFVLHSDTLLVLTNNPEALRSIFGEINALDVSLPALNNTSDQIRLLSGDGSKVDSLEYSPDWGGVDISIERRSLDVPSTFNENWGNTPSPDKGTPGVKNAILPDVDPPVVIGSGFLSNQEIWLAFNERLFGDSPTNPENYSNPIGPDPLSVVVQEDTVLLSYEIPFQDGDSVIIQLRNLEDLFGNVQNEQIVKLNYVEIGEETVRDVVFNEILYRRKDGVSPEFVELFNTSHTNFDLSGWSFSDASSSAEIPMETILNSGSYLVLTDQEDFAESLENGLFMPNFPTLNDSGDELVLRNSDGVTIDSLFYQSSWGGNEPGVSLERRDPLAASSDASNWGSSMAENGFSAGEISTNFEEDVIPPGIIFSVQSDSMVRVVFSEFVVTNTESRFYVNDRETRVINFAGIPGNELFLKWMQDPIAVPSKRGISVNMEVRIENISDVKGNEAQQISLPIASPIVKGSVVINEILYNPLADNEDNLPDQSEYIEIYNRSNTARSLEGLFIHDAPDEENEVRAIMPISTQFKWIPPGAYYLIYSEDESEEFSQSKIAIYFELDRISEAEVIRIDRSSLSLASTGDAIFLANSTGEVIDSVFFDESWQNPNLIDTRGVALERIDPNGPSNNSSNWSSSTHVSGGTPLLENTIFQEVGAVPENEGISFTPNPFSPDEDGFEDNLFITYKLDQPDYLLRVRIFDRYGREVRELANNFQAGFEGSLIWDGLTDDRRSNRVGIYIVLFEASDSSNGRDHTFKKTVVLARKF